MLDEDTFTKLWKLTNEWAAQQKSNHELASGISKQIADYKQKVEASRQPKGEQQQAFPLLANQQQPDHLDRATDELLTDYKALLELYQTVLRENQGLQREKSQLQEICKEYEDKFETIAEKLRNHTVASTEGHVQLRREYEALLDAEKSTTAELFVENMMLRDRLFQLASMVRDAYQVQDDDDGEALELARLRAENQGLREILHISQLSNNTKLASPPSHRQPALSAEQVENLDGGILLQHHAQQQQPPQPPSSSGVVETYFQEQ